MHSKKVLKSRVFCKLIIVIYFLNILLQLPLFGQENLLSKSIFALVSSTGVKELNSLIDEKSDTWIVELTIDKTLPEIANILDGKMIKKNVIFNYVDKTSLAKVTLNNENYVSNAKISDEGQYNLVITGSDNNTVQALFTIDKTPPVVTGIEEGQVYSGPVEISWNEGLAILNATNMLSNQKKTIVTKEGNYIFRIADEAKNTKTINFSIGKNGEAPPTPQITSAPQNTSTAQTYEKIQVAEKEIDAAILKAQAEKKNAPAGTVISVDVKAENMPEEKRNLDIAIPAKKMDVISSEGFNCNINAGDITFGVTAKFLKEDILSKNPTEIIFSKGEASNDAVSLARETFTRENSDSKALGKVHDFKLMTKDENGNLDKVENFSEGIAVTIKLASEDRAKIVDPRKVAIYNLREDGTYEYAGGKVTDKGLEFNPLHFSYYIVMENNATFRDILNSFAKDHIEVLSSRNIVRGFSNGTFQPKSTITRGQFSILLSKAMLVRPEKYSVVFSDVKPENFFAGFVLGVYGKGYMKGEGSLFKPLSGITREDMAVILVNSSESLIGLKQTVEKSDATTFNDYNQIADYAKEKVLIAHKMGLVTGYKGDFKPKDYLSREEAAIVFMNYLNKYRMI